MRARTHTHAHAHALARLCSVFALLMLFWPLAWLPCVMEGCYDRVYQADADALEAHLLGAGALRAGGAGGAGDLGAASPLVAVAAPRGARRVYAAVPASDVPHAAHATHYRTAGGDLV